MNKRLFLSLLLTIILCLGFAGKVFAQTVTVGVSPGNVFKYKVTYFWSSTNSSATPPSTWVEANSTEYYQATITEITGTTISLTTVQHFLNGTDIDQNELIDVGNSLGGSLLVYASNLSGGSYLYPAATSLPWKVNATVTRPYGSGNRDTNWIEVRMTGVEGYIYRFTSLYFDKATGVLVDAIFEDVYAETPEQTYSRSIKITDSSLWTVAAAPSDGDGDGDGQTGGLPMEAIYAVIAVVVVVVVIVSVVLVLRKRGKSKKL